MARKFVILGLICLFLSAITVLLGLVLGSGSLFGDVGDLSRGNVMGVGIIFALLSPALGFFGTMFFLAGLIGFAVNRGAEEPVGSRDAGSDVCPECGETDNPVGSRYCRTCGTELSGA